MAALLTWCAHEMGHNQPWGEESRAPAVPDAHRVPSTDTGAGHCENIAASQAGEIFWGMCSARNSKANPPI